MPGLEFALDALPLFPLPEATLFPGVPMALHVFEPRYREMLRDCIATHRSLAIVQIVAAGEPPEMARVAGAGTIIRHELLPDGCSNIVVLGQARVKLEELPFVAPYRRAKATIVTEPGGRVADTERAALVSVATRFVEELRRAGHKTELTLPTDMLGAGELADTLAHQLVLDGPDRQRVLECLALKERVRCVTEALSRQTARLFRRDDRPGARVLN